MGLTFTQWLVLEAARELIAQADDAVIQNEIAASVEPDRSTVAQVMIKLEMKDLISRDVDITGREAISASHFDDPLMHTNLARRAARRSDFDDWP